MPNLDGATLARALRRMNPGAKVLVISGMASSFTKRLAENSMEFADAFIPKPFKPGVLLEKVHELLSFPGRGGLAATDGLKGAGQ
ncbi:MAG: response regulator [Opitutus sp.]|nr:response regulator [Opitutus sp.]